jgi:hypothetical protein
MCPPAWSQTNQLTLQTGLGNKLNKIKQDAPSMFFETSIPGGTGCNSVLPQATGGPKVHTDRCEEQASL